MTKNNDSFDNIILDLSKEKRRNRLVAVILSLISISAVLFATALFFFFENQKNQPKQTSQVSETSWTEDFSKREAAVQEFAQTLVDPHAENADFMWNLESAHALPMDKEKGGADLKSVLAAFGKPTEAGGWISIGYLEEKKQIRLTWKANSRESSLVQLVFESFEERYKVISKRYTNLQTDEKRIDRDPNRDFTWTQEFFDSLIVGSKEGTDKGTVYDEVLAQTGLPFHQEFSGEDNQLIMRVSYIKANALLNDAGLQSVILVFYKQDDGSWRLVEKQAR